MLEQFFYVIDRVHRMREIMRVTGLVQGIGFRPFVAETAEKLNITGWVRNTEGLVTILADGDESAIEEMIRIIREKPPVGAWIEDVRVEEICEDGESDGANDGEYDSKYDVESRDGRQAGAFRIIKSNHEALSSYTVLPADIATCDRCLAEMHDPTNRRYRHPFISCTACGPRYSIIDEIPYDRDHISMRIFDMCPDCENEYTKKGNIRRHAQTIACRDCGPRLGFEVITDAALKKDPEIKPDAISYAESYAALDTADDDRCLKEAIRLLNDGAILAIKDIGGYHLACSPFEKKAVEALRAIKGRESKPFAVMFADMDALKRYCLADEDEEGLLTSPARPIVLVKKRDKAASPMCQAVCGTSPDIGAMLPCNPLQALLTEACGPLIMTSANITGEIITTDDDKMKSWMEEASGKTGVSLAVLSNDRPIVTPLDDSVMKVVNGRQQFIRRARGYVPLPISLPVSRKVISGRTGGHCILAAGGDLKSCFGYYVGIDKDYGRAYLSQHLGDLDELGCMRQYDHELKRMSRLFGFDADMVATDKHPGYESVRYFAESTGRAGQAGQSAARHVMVQHHKAHVASVVAEHGLTGKVIGFAFDGTGYGDDGTVWGSEVFTFEIPETDGMAEGCSGRNAVKIDRIAHLAPVRLIGGDEGARNADTILCGYLREIAGVNAANMTDLLPDKYDMIGKAIDAGLNTITSTSMGRLFDAVSAMLGICHYNSYEGQAAMELENEAAGAGDACPLGMEIIERVNQGYDKANAGVELIMDTGILFAGIADALDRGVDRGSIARGFIIAVSDAIVEISRRVRERDEGYNKVALSGGTFLNRILLEDLEPKLLREGFEVYRNEQVPPGDGGLCLGQMYLAMNG